MARQLAEREGHAEANLRVRLPEAEPARRPRVRVRRVVLDLTSRSEPTPAETSPGKACERTAGEGSNRSISSEPSAGASDPRQSNGACETYIVSVSLWPPWSVTVKVT